MFNRLIKLSLAVVVLLMASTTFAKLPRYEFVCHVTTVINVDGLYFVQADSISDASNAALKGKAFTITDKHVKSEKVVECIEKGKGEFSDPVINEFYKVFPMP